MMTLPTMFRTTTMRRAAKAGVCGVAWAVLSGTAMGLPSRPGLASAPAARGATSLTVIVADFNHDGIPDVLVPASSGASATIAFGSVPYGSFSSNATAVTFPSACTGFVADAGNYGNLLAGDLNGDGFADIVFTCNTSGGTLTGAMLGKGDGTFAAPVTITSTYANGAVLGDFDRDGKMDVVLVGYPNGVGGTNDQTPAILFFAGKGDGTFAAAVASPLGSSATFEPGNFILGSPVAADVNGDGYLDIVVNGAFGYTPTNYAGATLTISVFGNRKDGTFGATASALRLPDATAAVGTYPASQDLKVIAGSFTGMGTTDFAVPDTGTPGVFVVQNRSTASGYLLATGVKTAYAGLSAAAAGNFTGSGFTDLVVANGTNLVVLANDGNGNFAASYGALTSPSSSGLFAVADANSDGYADVYTATMGTGLQLGVNLVSGSATATSQPFSLGVGTAETSATWAGNVLFTGATATGTQTVTGASSLVRLSSSKNPSTVGDTVTFTAVAVAVAGSPVVPTGLMSFSEGTNALGNGYVDRFGRATLATNLLSQGTHQIVATYLGDGFYAASTSDVLPQVVNAVVQVVPRLVWVVPSAITYGTPLSGTQLDAVAATAAGTVVPGTYLYTPAAGTVLPAGVQTLSVIFTPTDPVAYAGATATVPLTVVAAGATTGLTVSSGGSAVSSVAAGSVVTLTATVTAGTLPVTTGQVRFCDAAASYCTDVHLLGTAQLTSAGTAVVRFVPGIGVHSYKAVFVGTANDVGSASAVSALTVTGTFATTTTIAQSGAVGNYTLTAMVSGVGNGTHAPTGTVSFLDTSNGNAVLASGPVGAATSQLNFRNSATPATGQNPINIASADLNGNGKRDLIIANSGSNTLTILLGNGDGSFTAAASPATGGYPDYLAIGDFNGDGKPDIAVTNYFDGTVTILLGNGDGTFTAAPVSPSTGVPARSIVAADFNGDGKLDLAVGKDNSVAVLLGNGDGTFTAAASPSTGSGPNYSIATGDFNGDGVPDLVVSNYVGNTLTVLLGNGDGTFAAAAASPVTGTSPETVAVGDFNGDGKADLAVANEKSAFLTILLGKGDGTFVAAASPSSGAAGSAPQSVTVGDLNGDGIADLVVVNQNTNNITLLLGNGDGTFAVSTGPAVGTNPDRTAIADFNGDGIADLAVTNVADGTISVLLTQLQQTVVATATGISPAGSGQHQVVASYPGDGVYTASVSAPASLTGPVVTPVLTWTPAVATIAYGTALGASQLNATATGAGGTAVAGTFTYTPAAGTVLQAGTQTLRVLFTPASTNYVAVSGSATITVTQAQPRLTWATPAAIGYGTALSASQLNASVTGVGGGALAGVLTYTPAAGAVLAPGMQTLMVSFAPADAIDYTGATGSVPLAVTGLTLSAIMPTTGRLGDPATTITLSGSGFVTSSVVRVNGAPIATTYVSGTTLTAVVPAIDFTALGTLQITVANPTLGVVSAAQPLTVIAANPAVTLTGPGVTAPGSQPTVVLTITNPYPLPLAATFSLSFASVGSAPVDDPAIQFAAGGRTLTIMVPANSTVVPPVQLQAGTDAGTITIPLVLMAGGVNVTPTGLAPVVIVVPATVPTLSTATLTRGTGTLSVAIHGFSNTREVTMATFHFVAAPGASISTPDITAPVGTVFGAWFGSAPSVPFGSTFTYTQVFNVSDDPKNIESVQVTLTNGVGRSALMIAQ